MPWSLVSAKLILQRVYALVRNHCTSNTTQISSPHCDATSLLAQRIRTQRYEALPHCLCPGYLQATPRFKRWVTGVSGLHVNPQYKFWTVALVFRALLEKRVALPRAHRRTRGHRTIMAEILLGLPTGEPTTTPIGGSRCREAHDLCYTICIEFLSYPLITYSTGAVWA